MISKSCYRLVAFQAIKRRGRKGSSLGALSILAALCFGGLSPVRAGDAPGWMHAVANAPLPAHDEKTDAILLYSEDVTNVQPDGKIKSIERRVYKILRPSGRDYGIVVGYFDSNTKITGMRGWCIPAQGKDYEVKDKEAIEVSIAGVEYSELITDQKDKVLRIPAADPGNVVGYEIETEEHRYILQDWWGFQKSVPVREARYTLQLPPGWEFKAVWMNSEEVKPTSVGNNAWQWVVSDVKALQREDEMPPVSGLARQVLVSLLPPGTSDKRGFVNWAEMGKWEANLAQGRRDASPELKQKVAELTANSTSTLAKMKALAQFVQRDVRYVAIELGIGGWQPHAARDIYAHRYGDCKDKATLMSAMLREIGVESYYLTINATRGGVNAQTPPQMFWFNHEILGIRLPDDVQDPSLVAIYVHPTLGRILIFDPTSELTPLGQVGGYLQANYGLLVTPEGGELIQVPQLKPSLSGIHRTGKLALSPGGTLSGEIVEIRYGDDAASQRYALRTVTKDADRIKPMETLLSNSIGTFQITKASIGDLQLPEKPLQYNYAFTADKYAKLAGDMLLVRPRIVGNKSKNLLETKEPRKFPVEFEGPKRDIDTFEIKLPAGYEVDDLPPAMDVEYSFGSYHSKTEKQGDALRYTRTFEIKELSVPLVKVEELKKFYRMIASDERNTAVLKPVAH